MSANKTSLIKTPIIALFSILKAWLKRAGAYKLTGQMTNISVAMLQMWAPVSMGKTRLYRMKLVVRTMEVQSELITKS